MLSRRPFAVDFVMKVFLPALTAALGIAVILFSIVNGIFDEANRLDRQYAHRTAEAAVQSFLEGLKDLVADNAQWDDAVRNAYDPLNHHWINETWGQSTAFGIYDMSIIAGPDGTIRAQFADGEAIDAAEPVIPLDVLARFLALLPGDGKTFAPRAGLISFQGKIIAAAAADILPASKGSRLPQDRPNVIVLARTLDAAALARLSRQFTLQNLKLSAIGDGDAGGYPIRTFDGAPAARLVWTERRPGDAARRKFGWSISLFALTTTLIIGLLLYASWRGFRDSHNARAKAIAASLQDDLTGLANRRSMQARLTEILAAPDLKGGLSVVYADLDGFKTINDTNGHDLGDRLLRAVAAGFRHLAGEDALVARLGGDEFAIIVTGDNCAGRARDLARNMIAFLSEPLTLGSRIASVSVSAGVVDAQPEDTPAEVLRCADIAMYSAKSAGRNCMRVYDRSLDTARTAGQLIEAELRMYIAERRIGIVYQPIVEANSGRIVGAEALARWPEGTGRYVTPDVFIPVAEEAGLIEELGIIVLEEACMAASKWPGVKLYVNAAAKQFTNSTFPIAAADAARAAGLDPARLGIEVTESCVLGQAARAAEVIEQFRAQGIGVVLDDFGTGFSSISHLRQFPFETVKFDRSLVKDIGKSPSALRLVQGAVAMAQALELTVTAEGVEDADQMSVLRLAGCNYFQGYHFSKPVAAEAFGAMLAEKQLGQASTAA